MSEKKDLKNSLANLIKQAREEIVSIIEKKYGLTLKQEPVELE